MYTILAMATPDYAQVWDFCIKSHREYCARHGFTYEIHADPLPGLNAKWSKIQYTINALERSEAVMLIDADAEFRPGCPSFVPMLDEAPDADILYANGHSGRLNSGMMIFRGDMGRTYLQEVLDRRHVPVAKEFFVTVEGENGHMVSVMAESPYRDHAKVISSDWNCTEPEGFATANIRHYTARMRAALDHGELGFRRPGESPVTTARNILRRIKRRFV